VAVATPKGLVTPVVRNAEGMGFVEIEKEIANLGKKVRRGVEQLIGGTLTVRVLGPGRQTSVGRHVRWHVYHVSFLILG
jgi:pyruvate/2-oxoglutarate dehydrogenase complex dihydrolipoamide acyltransferase (E2) component